METFVTLTSLGLLSLAVAYVAVLVLRQNQLVKIPVRIDEEEHERQL